MSNAATSLTAGTRLVRVLAALALLFSVGTLSACNMMEGAGEDISAGGDALDDAAEDAKD
ncbi:entericidin A/B family lipoprotein [Geminicoccus flavidas]|uniref:entericidin A/B family lipoprotein n=1 Tax=Geminicoccus flavidas TaxID=2506407 RepID=UPI0013597FFC